MESLAKKLLDSEGKLLVAQGKRDGDDYALVLGKITSSTVPKYGKDEWDKKGERMVPVHTSRNPRVHCTPVMRREWIDEILRQNGLKHYKGEFSYLRHPITRYVDKTIVDPQYGFELTYLALISLEDGQKNVIFPPGFKERRYERDEKSRNLSLTEFLS